MDSLQEQQCKVMHKPLRIRNGGTVRRDEEVAWERLL